MKLLKKIKSECSGAFVIESNVSPRLEAKYDFYRCNRHFKKLLTWLRKQGITKTNAIHELRKEFGSQLMEHFGLR